LIRILLSPCFCYCLPLSHPIFNALNSLYRSFFFTEGNRREREKGKKKRSRVLYRGDGSWDLGLMNRRWNLCQRLESLPNLRRAIVSSSPRQFISSLCPSRSAAVRHASKAQFNMKTISIPFPVLYDRSLRASMSSRKPTVM
jgi:hypothetical protein